MKKMYSLMLGLFMILSFTLQTNANAWKNFSNFSSLTDAQKIGTNIWFTAKGGLVVLNTTNGNKTYYQKGDAGLPSSSVEQIALRSQDNTIWIGTYDNGIAKWNGTSFDVFPYPTNFLMHKMKFDPNGNLWLQTNTGVYQYNVTSNTYKQVNSFAGIGWSVPAWSFDFAPDNTCQMFTGTNVLVVDINTLSAIDSFPNSTSPAVSGCTPTNVDIQSISSSKYMINSPGGLEIHDMDGTYITVSSGLTAPYYVNEITKDDANNIYIVVDIDKIYKFDGVSGWILQASLSSWCTKMLHVESGDFFYATNNQNEVKVVGSSSSTYQLSQHTFASNEVRSVFKGLDGKLNVQLLNKIYSFDEANNAWTEIASGASLYGTYSSVRNINNKLYLIDNGNIMYIYNGTTWQHVPAAPTQTDMSVFSYDVSPSGDLYFTNTEGLFKFNGTSTSQLLTTPSFGASAWYLSVTFDDTRNCLWMNTSSKLIKYDFSTLTNYGSTEIGLIPAGVSTIKVAPNGNVYFGGYSNLFKYDGTNFTTIPAASFTTLSGNIVDIEFSGSDMFMLFSSSDEGIVKYDGTNYTTLTVANEPSLITDQHFDLLLNDGDLWVAHRAGGVSVLRDATITGIISNPVNNATMNVYPNPSSTTIQFDLQGKSANVQIVNAEGKIVMNNVISNGIIDISRLDVGLYYIQVVTENGSYFNNKFFKN